MNKNKTFLIPNTTETTVMEVHFSISSLDVSEQDFRRMEKEN